MGRPRRATNREDFAGEVPARAAQKRYARISPSIVNPWRAACIPGFRPPNYAVGGNNKCVQGLLHFSSLFRGSAIGSTPAFGAGYPGSSPGPGAILLSISQQITATSFSSNLGTVGTTSVLGNSKPSPIRSAMSARNFVSFSILTYLSVTVCRTTDPSLEFA